ncbi:MAG: hypothetical protein AMXMBFR84_39530 [Candidatus Hydrogenedentota bacterium]
MGRRIAYALVVVGLVLALGCFKKVPREKLQPLFGDDAGGAVSGDFPVFEEGGSLKLTVQGAMREIPLNEIYYCNTEGDFPDYIEFSGEGTYFEAVNEAKLPGDDEDDWSAPHASIVSKALPIKSINDRPMEMTIPGLGKYAVTGGTITMTRNQGGMEGVVWWEGTINVICDTSTGPATAPGTFAFGMVPVW